MSIKSVVVNVAVMFVCGGALGSSSLSNWRVPSLVTVEKSPWRAKQGMSCFVSRVRS